MKRITVGVVLLLALGGCTFKDVANLTQTPAAPRFTVTTTTHLPVK